MKLIVISDSVNYTSVEMSALSGGRTVRRECFSSTGMRPSTAASDCLTSHMNSGKDVHVVSNGTFPC